MAFVSNENTSAQYSSKSSHSSGRSARSSHSTSKSSKSWSSSSSSMSRSSRSSLSSRSTNIGSTTHFLGKEVLINRGGPDSTTGLLRRIGSDYLVAQVSYSNNQNGNNYNNDNNKNNNNWNQPEYEIVYIRTSHVKSMSLSSQNSVDSYELVPFIIHAADFNGVMKKLKHHFVQINNNGPEKLDGFIVDVSDDAVFLIVDRETIRISNFHIKSIRVSSQTIGYTGNDNSNNNNNNNNKSSSNNKNKNNNKNSNKNNKKSNRKSNKKSNTNRKSSNNKRRSNSKKNSSKKNK